MRILLVEDNEMNVELFRAALESEGHEIVVERDGASGEMRAFADEFDLILLDVHLPKRGGLEVCRALRTAEHRLPIVALSASALPDEVAQAKAAGCDEFLAKPVSPDALRAAVLRWRRLA